MSTNNANADASIGHATSGEQGATPTHETMAETGGSGGEALTKPKDAESAPRAAAQPGAGGEGRDASPAQAQREGADTAATAMGRGHLDTRSDQADPGSTGLGTPETGANQDERDLAPPRRD